MICNRLQVAPGGIILNLEQSNTGVIGVFGASDLGFSLLN